MGLKNVIKHRYFNRRISCLFDLALDSIPHKPSITTLPMIFTSFKMFECNEFSMDWQVFYINEINFHETNNNYYHIHRHQFSTASASTNSPQCHPSAL